MFPPTVLDAIAVHATPTEITCLCDGYAGHNVHRDWLTNIASAGFSLDIDEFGPYCFRMMLPVYLKRFLKAVDSAYDVLWWVVANGYFPALKWLLEPVDAGGTVISMDDILNHGLRFFRRACLSGCVDMVKFIYYSAARNGRDITARQFDAYNICTLRLTCGRGHIGVIKFLLAPKQDGGAGLTTDRAKSVAITWARKRRRTKLVEFLESNEAMKGMTQTQLPLKRPKRMPFH